MACTCEHEAPPAAHQWPCYRRTLWLALILNAAMFVVELVGSQRADSLSLMADAIDFAGDALNYGVSLAVLGAALGVAGTHTAWPDLAVAALMATLALQGGLAVRRQAKAELAAGPAAADAAPPRCGLEWP